VAQSLTSLGRRELCYWRNRKSTAEDDDEDLLGRETKQERMKTKTTTKTCLVGRPSRNG